MGKSPVQLLCNTLHTDDRCVCFFSFKSAKVNCNFVAIVLVYTIRIVISLGGPSLFHTLHQRFDGVSFVCFFFLSIYTFLIDAIISLHNSFLIFCRSIVQHVSEQYLQCVSKIHTVYTELVHKINMHKAHETVVFFPLYFILFCIVFLHCFCECECNNAMEM